MTSIATRPLDAWQRCWNYDGDSSGNARKRSRRRCANRWRAALAIFAFANSPLLMPSSSTLMSLLVHEAVDGAHRTSQASRSISTVSSWMVTETFFTRLLGINGMQPYAGTKAGRMAPSQ